MKTKYLEVFIKNKLIDNNKKCLQIYVENMYTYIKDFFFCFETWNCIVTAILSLLQRLAIYFYFCFSGFVTNFGTCLLQIVT